MNKLFALALLVCFACSTKEKKSESAEWKELASFHKIMAASFHPLDSGNVEPAKKLASQLADEAASWASATLPEKVNNDEMKSNLEKLKTDSRALADEIGKGASDDAIKEKLTALHQQFHKIMEGWEGHGHDEGEEH